MRNRFRFEAACLLLYQLQFLGFQQLLRHALRASLCTEAEIPQLLAERRSIFVEKTGELDLERLDIGLKAKEILALGCEGCARGETFGEVTHVSGSLDEIEAKLNDHIILTAQDLRDLSRYPSERGVTRQSRRAALAREEPVRAVTYFFMTCRLTLVMSTFWLNSGGNLVLLRSFASTPVAMMGRMLDMVCRLRYSRKTKGAAVTSEVQF